MCGIAASGQATCHRVDAKGSLLKRETGVDQRQDLPRRRPGVERTITPPIHVAHSYVAHVKAATVAETLGNSEGHPKRSANPVPRC